MNPTLGIRESTSDAPSTPVEPLLWSLPDTGTIIQRGIKREHHHGYFFGVNL